MFSASNESEMFFCVDVSVNIHAEYILQLFPKQKTAALVSVFMLCRGRHLLPPAAPHSRGFSALRLFASNKSTLTLDTLQLFEPDSG